MEGKRIAVFATGWGPEIIEKYIKGLREGFKDDKVDIYMFLNYAHSTNDTPFTKGELNIYNLPDMHDFDGAVVIGNGLDFPGVFDSLTRRCKEAGIPAVCTGREDKNGAYFVGSDNEIGARELYEHIIDVHECYDIVFMAGHKDNPDSNTRLKVLRECLEKRGYSLPEEKVSYTDWAPGKAADFVREWYNSGKKMPDAFVCANDILAMPVCDVLDRLGYGVPDDVIVTGYDNDFFSKIYDPVITSVDQCFDAIGCESAKILLKYMKGDSSRLEKRTLVPSRFVPAESCGCCTKMQSDKERRKACKEFFHNNSRISLFTGQLSVMEGRLLEGASVDAFCKNYESYLNDNKGSYEGESFHLLLEPSFEESIFDTSVACRTKGYSEVMNVVVSKENGVIKSGGSIERSRLIPYVSEEIAENRFFVFLPVHKKASNYGYVVFGDDMEKISDYNYMWSYVSRLSTILQLYRQRLAMNYLNGKLVEYSNTDPLTHVKNRGAYKEVEEKINGIIKSVPGYNFGIVMFDVNNLKKVNDELGHEAGDKYIVGASAFLCEIFSAGRVYRIGGDEFVCVLKDKELEEFDMLFEELKDKMAELQAQDIPLYKKYSIAAGMAVYDPKVDKLVSDVLKRADREMYANKIAMKAQRQQ